VKMCGSCHPGGGGCEYDRKGHRYDKFAKDPANEIRPMGDNYLDGDYYQSDWAESGVLEADCLICHLQGYNWEARAQAIGVGFFYEAPAIGAGWFRRLKKHEPTPSSATAGAISFHLDYSKTEIADPVNLAAAITKEVPEENCCNCHQRPDTMKRGKCWDASSDVHKAKGLSCSYCHPSENHEMAKGDILLGSVRDNMDGGMKSCTDCHEKRADERAPKPNHDFPDLHIEKMYCEACHIPYKVNTATAVIDNATTGKSRPYPAKKFLSNNPLDAQKTCKDAPENTWCPGFVIYKGKIKPVNPMQVIWWGDWDQGSHRVIPIILWRIRDFTGAKAQNNFSITNCTLLEALDGSSEVNTAEEIKTYLRALAQARDRYGCRVVYHTAVLVKGGMIYYLKFDELHHAPMPKHDGGFTCCEPFDLSHNVVGGEAALGSRGCDDCHVKPSPFFNRKVLIDPYDSEGKPVYKEAWEIIGYSKERMLELTLPVE
jgi:hypothetical protein